ncbi:DUF2786 domain-containing protein [Streptomyces sp. H27-D2]|uniref:DUF2786 domain-containing protein n=1 Tax=Streptomyces sp. H27-D2 TaxID=3046304 RepID=UPI002DBBE0EB|nr:DUF2786 domain-containing protein [Streptomyces sp. H27-D2]MEC4021002.1 DUF2786 domain-containing protein [Streptomyces sp. H27-D2]
MLGSVLYAPEAALDDAVDSGASQLTAAAEGWDAVSRALLGTASARLRRCWEDGWQPADLIRLVRRDLAPEQLRFAVDSIAAEARRYPAATLDPRWAGQLRELDATVWWDGDETFLEGFARRERMSRFETAGCALVLLRTVGRLPRIAPVGPPPGAQGAAGPRTDSRTAPGTNPRTADAGTPAPAPATTAAPRMLGRIRALLAKAESTEFAEEAEALSAKAQQLMAQHSISEALLAAHASGGPADGPGACRIGVEGPYESAKALLLDAVAAANRCQAVWSNDFDFSTVVGFESDLELVELLYTSLLLQATTAMNRAGNQHHARSRSRRTKDFRQSFLLAYAGRIRDRLTAATDAAVSEAAGAGGADGGGGGGGAGAPDLLPVLAAREVAVEETAERMFPARVSHRMRGGRDAEGWAHGTAAADQAVLRWRSGVIPEG